jgi:hypothetical protein
MTSKRASLPPACRAQVLGEDVELELAGAAAMIVDAPLSEGASSHCTASAAAHEDAELEGLDLHGDVVMPEIGELESEAGELDEEVVLE